MEDSRYVLDPAPVRLTDGKLALLLLTAAAILALCGYTFFTRLPMDWQPDAPVSQEAEAIRQELRDLNFPEEVLQDLSEEDLLACQGATRVVVQQKLEELEQMVIDARFECTGPQGLTTTEYEHQLTKMLKLIRSIDEVNES